MRAEEFTLASPGELLEIDDKGGVAFEPYPLPPEITIDTDLARRIGDTERILGRLDGRGHGLANPYILVQPFLRREALASSRIEGTTAVIEEVLRFEAGEPQTKNPDDVQEVINYLNALRYGLSRPSERPFSLGFLNELHQLILADVRGQERHPGTLRKIQVVIGRPGSDLASARFVPPPPTIIQGLLDQLLEWLSIPDKYPDLIRLAFLHYQFETIHPYEDGNGRLGRLMITLILKEWGIMEYPLLYLSEYFEKHKPAYLDHLLSVSQRGAWNDWIRFFLGAVKTQASDALHASTQIIELREAYKRRYQAGRPQAYILDVIDQLFESVVVSVSRLAEQFDVRHEQIQRALNTLTGDGLIRELTGKRRDRLYASPEILTILNQRSSD
jgi:Fic family protein